MNKNLHDTVKVRIAVAVAPEGEWMWAGWPLKGKGHKDRPYWVTAELPIPQTVEVEGEVSDE